MTASGWKASSSCLIRAAGSDASTGRIAGPLPSSARASGSSSRAASPAPFEQHRVQRAAVAGRSRAGGEVTDD